MRLTCPNCDAVYEVPADAVPPEGRDVQCTNCGHAWFQAHPHLEAEDPEEAPAPSSRLDPEARRVLEEEAELEIAARVEERGRSRRPPPAPTVQAAEAEAEIEAQLDAIEDDRPALAMEAEEPAPAAGEAAPAAAVAVPYRKRRRGKDLLPDIDEVDGSLKQAGERKGGRKIAVPAGDADRARRGFRLGFGLTVLAFAALAVIYVFAAEIAALIPAAEPVMARYVETVDGLRTALDAFARDAAAALSGWVDSLSAEAG